MKALAATLVLSCAVPWARAQAPAALAPARFERVLWSDDAGARAAAIAAQGYTAVQLGRGADPEPLQRAGLGYYLDQPVGKGVLELRDAEWRAVQAAYEKARDPAVLIRPGCVQTPGLVEQLARDAAAEAVRVAGPGLRFVALADEASATRHDAPLDTCRCEHCLTAYRAFLRQRCANVDAVNAACGTQFASFDDCVPVTTDQLRRRELGDTQLPRDLRAFALHRDFCDKQYADAIAAIAAAVRAAVPGVPVGLTGLQVPAAFGGSDPARLAPMLTLAEPYDVGGAVEIYQSLLPRSARRFATLAPPSEAAAAAAPMARLVRAQLAAMAAHGLDGVVVWNDAGAFGPDGKATPFGAAVSDAFARLGPVLDACAGAAIETAPVWLVESQASVRVWWMLDSKGDGMTWLRRYASYEQTHSTSQAARLGWIRVLQDLGLQPRFVAEAELPERLLRERPRCLVLPATIALADRALQAIDSWVRSGGTLLADHSAALYDGDLLRRERGGLDLVFDVTQRSNSWDDLLVREGRGTAAASRGLPIAERGLRGRLAERGSDGETFLEHDLGRGHAIYLNTPVCDYARLRLDAQEIERARELRRRVRAALQRAQVEAPAEVVGQGLPTCIERVSLRLRDGRAVLALRVNALDAPAVLARLGKDGAREIQLVLPVEHHLRLLGGDDLGTGAKFDLKLDAFAALFLEDVAR